MTDYIGARISLLSNSDIRYVGTLHEINSETSTVALEQVVSFGTEGRRGDPDDEIAPADNIYEYIVFRGSDVKDLRIEEAPAKENVPPPQPKVPDDPAILGSGSRPVQAKPAQGQASAPGQQSQIRTTQGQLPNQQQHRPGQPQPPQFPQQPPFPYYYPPPPGRGFAPPHGYPPPGPGGYPNMPFAGAPPGWYPPPGQGFPGHPGPFAPGPMGFGGPPGHPIHQPQEGPQGGKGPQPAPIGPAGSTGGNEVKSGAKGRQHGDSKPSSKPATPAPSSQPPKGPALPLESKPDVAKAVAPVQAAAQIGSSSKPAAPSGAAPLGAAKGGRIVPAVPLSSPGQPKAPQPANATGRTQAAGGNKGQPNQAAANAAIQNATQMATAAVAAAMAKLPPAPGQAQGSNDGVDNLTKRVNEMRTNDHTNKVRASRQPSQPAAGGAGGFNPNHRGRGGPRGHHHPQQGRKVEVPNTDYDFASANAKFNKQDLVKEVIATGSPTGDAPSSGVSNNGVPDGGGSNATNGTRKDSTSEGASITPTYNKSTSFFDNISSETKDRSESQGHRPGGREWRGEEVKRNLETFGQGSVDNGGYRGGFRGRGRGGRGGGYRGRGRGGSRGGLQTGGAAPATA